jgi:hypothetical protein
MGIKVAGITISLMFRITSSKNRFEGGVNLSCQSAQSFRPPVTSPTGVETPV